MNALYDSDSAESEDETVKTSQSSQRLFCGSFCARRVQRYHMITHFMYNEMYSKLKNMATRSDYGEIEIGKARRKAMISRLEQEWTKTVYTHLKTDIQNAADFSNQTGVWYQRAYRN